jgi:thymidine kinase
MLTVITGSMFASKSKTLINLCFDYVRVGKYVIGFRPLRDTRHIESTLRSHDGLTFPATLIESTDEIPEVLYRHEMYNNPVDVVAIDEFQFFDKKTAVATIEELLCYTKLSTVLLSGLAQDSFGRPFGAMGDVLAMADNIIKLNAICSKCNKLAAATRTSRLTDDKNTILVGGSNIFEPRCFSCWSCK